MKKIFILLVFALICSSLKASAKNYLEAYCDGSKITNAEDCFDKVNQQFENIKCEIRDKLDINKRASANNCDNRPGMMGDMKKKKNVELVTKQPSKWQCIFTSPNCAEPINFTKCKKGFEPQVVAEPAATFPVSFDSSIVCKQKKVTLNDATKNTLESVNEAR